MKNKLLLTTAMVTVSFIVSANALEYTPYISGKISFARMNNNANYDLHYVKNDNTSAPDASYSRNHKDSVWGLRVAGGAFTPMTYGKIRTELEFGWNDEAKDAGKDYFKSTYSYDYELETKLSVYSTMINVYYDFDTKTALTPYLGAGLGIAHLKNKSTATALKVNGKTSSTSLSMSDTAEENHLAWNISAGVAYALTDNVSLDLGYRYTNFGKIKKARVADLSQMNEKWGTLNYPGEFKVDSHEVNLGVRYNF